VGKTLAKAAFVMVLIIVLLGVLRGQPLLEMFIFGIALAVAVVPEALPAVVTISLAIGYPAHGQTQRAGAQTAHG
jgi:P-type Ca2+ transporter type 2C